MVSGRLLGGTVAPADKDAAGGSGSNVGGAGFGNNTFCKDCRGGHRDESSTASFEGRGRTRPGASAICFSCLRQKYISMSIQRESRIPAVVDRDVAVRSPREVCCRLCYVYPAMDLAELLARPKRRNGNNSTVSRLSVRSSRQTCHR
ncbi:hypothetical protein PISMIDRAFT_619221 [Pisolithus microcarpus 441]|uniref:Uncharacterized protein n=1 Tax=Pisolithus microcarpus 441 TaxID=765257 RepID=A0A0C9Z056_9AGAM|nr:hypothetical protein BKA83DRAFT_619221 [Pisolithus microcarpus]KIK19649.1 hypothetical protein PISMIDRAFT_619221 [Pisolithus microcarpus 441]